MYKIIKYKDANCYFSASRYEQIDYSLNGISFDRTPNIIYTSGYLDGSKISGKIVHIKTYLDKITRETVKMQLIAYLSAHKFRYEIYKINSYSATGHGFYGDALRCVVYEEKSYDISYDYTNLIEGKVLVRVNGERITYDLKSQTFENAKPFFQMVYKRDLLLIMGKAQLMNGVAPAALTELNNLKEFFKSKKRVTVNFKDGTKSIIKMEGLGIHGYLSLLADDDKIQVSLSGFINRPIEEVDFLGHGKDKHYINLQNFQNLLQPLKSNDNLWPKTA